MSIFSDFSATNGRTDKTPDSHSDYSAVPVRSCPVKA